MRVLRAAFSTLGPVAPAWAARCAGHLFRRPPRRAARAEEVRFLASGAPFRIPHGAGSLAAWQWGTTGPLTILVHGWGSRAGRWHALAPLLAEDGFRVLAYDAPAHGASSGDLASLPQFVRALETMVAHVAEPPMLLIGHSLGGSAVAMAMLRGVAAERAVLLSVPAEQRVFAERFADALALPESVRGMMSSQLEARFGFTWEDFRLPDLVGQLDAPALIIHDRQDPDVAFESAERIRDAWPGAELLATSGLGHSGVLNDPAVTRRIREFAGAGR
jgi:pimeloyl-ACP methyl ester carboxylesterase